MNCPTRCAYYSIICCWLLITLACQSIRAEEIRSVTYYPFPTAWSDFDVERVKRDIDEIQHAGFNCIWWPLHMHQFVWTALPETTHNEHVYTKLDAILDYSRSKGMQAILGLGYFGVGWTPEGMDDARRIRSCLIDQDYYHVFRQHCLYTAQRYGHHKHIIFLLFTENWEPDLAVVGERPELQADFRRFCRQLQPDLAYWSENWRVPLKSFAEMRTPPPQGARWEYYQDYYRWLAGLLAEKHGGVAREMKALGLQGRLCYHDYNLVNCNWAKGSSPIPTNDNPYDMVSMVLYPGYGETEFFNGVTPDSDRRVVEAHVSRLVDVAVHRYDAYWRKAHPNLPIICGEVGIPTLLHGELAQSIFFQRFLQRMGPRLSGFNIWMWQDFGPRGQHASRKERSFGLRRADGSEKPALRFLKKKSGIPLPVPDDGGV